MGAVQALMVMLDQMMDQFYLALFLSYFIEIVPIRNVIDVKTRRIGDINRFPFSLLSEV
jgi:hypothetical protein